MPAPGSPPPGLFTARNFRISARRLAAAPIKLIPNSFHCHIRKKFQPYGRKFGKRPILVTVPYFPCSSRRKAVTVTRYCHKFKCLIYLPFSLTCDSSDSSDSTFSHTRENFLGRQNFSFRRRETKVTVTVSLSLNSQ